MKISSKSIPFLARFITGDIDQTPYLTGIKLVEFFNKHGFDDVYEYGNNTFPARWKYVEQKLESINGSDNLKAVLEELIDDRDYLDKNENLETAVKYLNDIIKFDGYQAKRIGPIYKVVRIQIDQNVGPQKPRKIGGRPKGSRNKLTDKKYNWIRDKYHFLKKHKKAHAIEEHARLIRSELKTKSPDWWGKPIYQLETIVDIIKKQKWGD